MEKKPKTKLMVETSMVDMNYLKVYVMIKSYKVNSKTDNVIGIKNQYVTGIEYHPKTFYYKKGEVAYEFNDIGRALDFVAALAVNGYMATVEISPDFIMNPDTVFMNYPKKRSKKK